MQKNGRIPYYYKDQLVYEWEQNLEEIKIRENERTKSNEKITPFKKY